MNMILIFLFIWLMYLMIDGFSEVNRIKWYTVHWNLWQNWYYVTSFPANKSRQGRQNNICNLEVRRGYNTHVWINTNSVIMLCFKRLDLVTSSTSTPNILITYKVSIPHYQGPRASPTTLGSTCANLSGLTLCSAGLTTLYVIEMKTK